MKWQGGRRSGNVEDRRGAGGLGGGLGGGRFPGGGRMAGGGGLGIIVIIVLALIFGVDPSQLLNGGDPGSQVSSPTNQSGGPGIDDSAKEFVSVVLADTEDTWGALFRQSGRTYQQPKLVLFSGAVNSACGYASAAVGPFYCPGDRKVYLDTVFFDELATRFRATGDFAQAYVIAHEVGHHVQTLLGTSQRVEDSRRTQSEAQANQMSVKLELQADCFSGVWAHHANRSRGVVEPGDIDEALTAASQIGDDTLQREAQGYVVPESFTHGTSAQRARWFRKGWETGTIAACDTFNAGTL